MIRTTDYYRGTPTKRALVFDARSVLKVCRKCGAEFSVTVQRRQKFCDSCREHRPMERKG